jgi:pantothenate kinase-related protein Tda10
VAIQRERENCLVAEILQRKSFVCCQQQYAVTGADALIVGLSGQFSGLGTEIQSLGEILSSVFLVVEFHVDDLYLPLASDRLSRVCTISDCR